MVLVSFFVGLVHQQEGSGGSYRGSCVQSIYIGGQNVYLGQRSDGVPSRQTEGKSHGHLSSSAYMASLLPVPLSSSPASRPSSSPPIPVVVALPFSSDPLFDPRTFDPRFPTAVPVVTPVAVPVSLEATMEMALGAMEVQVAVPI